MFFWHRSESCAFSKPWSQGIWVPGYVTEGLPFKGRAIMSLNKETRSNYPSKSHFQPTLREVLVQRPLVVGGPSTSMLSLTSAMMPRLTPPTPTCSTTPQQAWVSQSFDLPAQVAASKDGFGWSWVSLAPWDSQRLLSGGWAPGWVGRNREHDSLRA